VCVFLGSDVINYTVSWSRLIYASSFPPRQIVTRIKVELTARELNLVKANMEYAIQNCPVEGGIIDVDGHISSEVFYRALLKKLKGVQVESSIAWISATRS